MQYLRTLQVQDHGKPDILGASHDLHKMENTGEYGDGVPLDLHAYSKKLTEGENKGKFSRFDQQHMIYVEESPFCKEIIVSFVEKKNRFLMMSWHRSAVYALPIFEYW